MQRASLLDPRQSDESPHLERSREPSAMRLCCKVHQAALHEHNSPCALCVEAGPWWEGAEGMLPGSQGGEQSSSISSSSSSGPACNQSLETAEQDAWQLFQQGGTPMYMTGQGPGAKHDVPEIDYGYGNATSESSASVMLSHELNGVGQGRTSAKDDDKQMNH